MDDIKSVRNTSTVPQSIVYKGQQFVLGPREEQTYEAEIANRFIEVCSPVVVDVSGEEFGQTFAPDRQAQTVWVANMTGNPELPRRTKVQRYMKTGTLRTEPVEVDHPNLEPRTLAWEFKGGHEQFVGGDGKLVQRTLNSRLLVVPPFKRRPFTKPEADFIFANDNLSEARGCVVESRAPSEFEPDMSWKLSDMRAYFRLTDPMADLGPDEKALGERARAETWDEKRATEEVRKAKQMCMRKLYFRLVNPAYRLPTRKEFNEFMTGKSEENIQKEELNEILAAADKTIASGARKLASASK
jgi:hypothetical protein